MHARTSRPTVLAALVGVAATLAACTGSDPGRTRRAAPEPPAFAEVPLSGAHPAIAGDYPKASSAGPCDPRVSLTPLDPLPAPGRMPTGSTMAAVHERGYLLVGVDQNTRFFAELDSRTSEIKGFDIDMANRLAQAIFGEPGHVRYLVITQAQRIDALTSGQVDVVVDTMTITCERKERVAFTSDYYTDGQRVLVRSDAGVRGLADLRGKRVCTVRGTTSIAFLRDDPAGVVPYAVDNWTDCLVALQQREVDAVSTTSALLQGLQRQDADTVVVGPTFTDEPHGMAFPLAHTDFVRFANALLERMKRDGEWQRLYDRSVRQALGPQGPPRADYAG